MKPVDLDQLDLRVAKTLKTGALENEVDLLRRQLDEKFGLENMIGSSVAMKRVFDKVRRAAPSSAITAKRGLYARAIELAGERGFKTLDNASALAPRAFSVDIFHAMHSGKILDLMKQLRFVAEEIHA